jgi:hypothetical protein
MQAVYQPSAACALHSLPHRLCLLPCRLPYHCKGQDGELLVAKFFKSAKPSHNTLEKYMAQMEAQSVAALFADKFNDATPDSTPKLKFTKVFTFSGKADADGKAVVSSLAASLAPTASELSVHCTSCCTCLTYPYTVRDKIKHV